ncbi:MAG: outer membrane lipoprotein carrier protein LolA [Proteobacteria bacterium]|nr:outer membrane lipoprotein carrier protein LolA [Pseudomonadota bacterium]
MYKILIVLLIGVNCVFSSSKKKAENANHQVQKEPTLKRLEEFLHLLPTIKATFIQINPNGEEVNGTLYIDRKNKKVRIEYPSLMQVYVVTDGFLFIHDKKQKDIQEMDASYTPVGLLLQPKIKFNDTVHVVNLMENTKEAFLTLSDTKDADHGTMSFHFGIETFIKLLGWKIVDMQGLETHVKIIHLEGGIPLDKALFLKPKA